MFRVLRFTPRATLAEVARSICRTPARRIALVFPLGDRTRFADTGRMDALATLCREHHKDATVVGGDELLRAAAVTGGLRAAVTLDDWRDAQPERGSRRAKARIDVPAQLVLIARPENQRADEQDVDDPLEDDFEVDPPAYVRELLALYRDPDDMLASSLRLERRDESPVREPMRLPRPFVVTARGGTLAYDLDSGERLRAISEDDEDRLTATIRRTSGLDAEHVASTWAPSLDAAAPDGSKGTR